MHDHDQFVRRAGRIFPGSKISIDDTYERARDRLFALLREENRHKPPVERWVSACRVTYDLHRILSPPQSEWAARILDNDLQTMLSKLHDADMAHDYSSARPNRWASQCLKDIQF